MQKTGKDSMDKAKREIFFTRWSGNEFWSNPIITKVIVFYFIEMTNR